LRRGILGTRKYAGWNGLGFLVVLGTLILGIVLAAHAPALVRLWAETKSLISDGRDQHTATLLPTTSQHPLGAAGMLASATAAQASPSSLRELPEVLQAAVSGALGLDDRSYHLERVGESCRGVNPAQQFEAAWSEGGLAIQAGKLSWGLRLEAWGYGEELASAGRAAPQANAHRVEYRRSGLTEWYVNGPLGIEQGFTVPSPPKRTSTGEALTLRLAWTGEARVQVGQGAAVVSNFAGEPVLRYGGLSAHDAAGRGLRAWLEQRGAAILLRVDDREAAYPVVIDPLIQQAKLTASDGSYSDQFGYSVSLSSDGNTALIGAEAATVGVNAQQGAAYVFVRSGTTWSQQQKLTASDGAGYDEFGGSVSLSSDGNTALIGAHGALTTKGAAYVFVRSGTTWSQQQKLTALDGALYNYFGCSVSLSSDVATALIGAYQATVGSNAQQGAAYVFANISGTWSQQQKLTSSDGAASDFFGWSVSLSADSTALIGAYRATVGSNAQQGAAYVFVYGDGSWSQRQKLTASDGVADETFGYSVSLSSDGSTALINGTQGSIGAAYVFVNSRGSWSQQAKLTASDGAALDDFGGSFSLSADGNTALIGASQATVGVNDLQGAAYVFARSGTTWSQQQKLTASDGAANDQFGWSVSLSSDGATFLIGAYQAKVGTHTSQGAAYVFAAPATTYSISGTVTRGDSVLYGVAMNLTGAATQSTSTDTYGNYSFSGLSNGVYTITPSKAGYTFSPVYYSTNVNGANITGKNFTAATATTTTLASSPNPSNKGQSVTFTATVSPSAATGTVTFWVDGAGVASPPLSSGIATYSTSSLSAGPHSIYAVYSGDSTYGGSTSSPVSQTVSAAATATTLASSPNPSNHGQSVTFTATVTPSAATGTVSFMDGTNPLGSASLSGGTATYSTSSLSTGTHSITAVYSGDSTYGGSTSPAVTQTVNKAGSSTTLGSSPNPSIMGQPVTFTAAVTPSDATGSVNFMDGTSPLGSATLSGGTATYSTSGLSFGSHSITAGYSGDSNYNGSTSLVITQTVNTVPGAPTGANATAGNAQAWVSFSPPASNGGSPITGYTVASSPSGGVDTGAGTTSTNHNITGLTNGTAYTFTVTATNAIGTGPPSSPSNSVTPTGSATTPSAPINVSATAGNSRATVSFSPPEFDGNTPITSYTVISSPGGAQATGTSSPITVNGLANGTSYSFTVTARNRVGSGPPSAPTTPITPATVPGAPTNVNATPRDGQVTVTFDLPANNGGSPITGVIVTSCLGDRYPFALGTPAVVTGLTDGTSYKFTVAAVNAVGAGPDSYPTNGVVPAKLPGAPTGVKAQAGNAQAMVSFKPPSSNGGSRITSYTVTTNPGGIETTGAASPITVKGLPNGTLYSFTVRATNRIGTGPPSEPPGAATPQAK